MSKASVAEYGTWKSPITSLLATENTVKFGELHTDKTKESDIVYWDELRPDEDGRYAVCSGKPTQVSYVTWSPRELSVRTLVHEYGGGSFCVHDGSVYFSSYKDQCMYVQHSPDSTPELLTPDADGVRYANSFFSTVLKRIYCVREDHRQVLKKESKEPTNTVAVINPQTKQQAVLVSGCDFYSSPSISPDGKYITWMQWNHPNMPWDDTEIWVATLDAGGDAIVKGSAKKVAGDKGVSVMQPMWTADGDLLYIGDQTNWFNLYHVTKSGDHVNLCPKDVEIGHPQWIFAEYAYDLDPKNRNRIATSYGGELGLLDMQTKEYKKLNTGFTSHSFIQFSAGGLIYCTAGSPTQFPCIIRVHPDTGKVDIVRESKTLQLDAGYLSVPKEISWETGDQEISYGYFYPPQNKYFVGPEESLPPLLVKAHGGPTAQCSSNLNLEIQYFTSQGFAVLDVNYRGSTGYGKAYRERLKGKRDKNTLAAQHFNQLGKWESYFIENLETIAPDNINGRMEIPILFGTTSAVAAKLMRNTYKNDFVVSWGICDVQDCSSGASQLVKEKQVDVNRLCIDGGSAGGYTTLACLAFNDVFKAGASHYGIGDMALLAGETHKFESRYCDMLVAPFVPENRHIFDERSPIKHIDGFNCPIAFFQGDEDKIVPPEQAVSMFNAVKAKGLSCAIVMFAGEQHGFRKAENVQKALDGEFYFFARVFRFDAANKGFSMKIENLA